MRGMLDDPATTVEEDFYDDEPPRSYIVTFHVNEKFVQLPRAEQTSRVLELATWFGERFTDTTLVFYAELKNRRIGWREGSDWIWWEDAYQIAVARLGAA